MKKSSEEKGKVVVLEQETNPPYYYNGVIKAEIKPEEKINREIEEARLGGFPFH